MMSKFHETNMGIEQSGISPPFKASFGPIQNL